MGHGQAPFSPFFLKATCFPTGPLIKNLVSKYPDGKMGEMEVSGGIRKTGYFLGLFLSECPEVYCCFVLYSTYFPVCLPVQKVSPFFVCCCLVGIVPLFLAWWTGPPPCKKQNHCEEGQGATYRHLHQEEAPGLLSCLLVTPAYFQVLHHFAKLGNGLPSSPQVSAPRPPTSPVPQGYLVEGASLRPM